MPKMVLYVRDADGRTVRSFTKECSISVGKGRYLKNGVYAEDEKLINFGCYYVTYYVTDLTDLQGQWFCIDAAGRNYGTQPLGVYVLVSDVKQAIQPSS